LATFPSTSLSLSSLRNWGRGNITHCLAPAQRSDRLGVPTRGLAETHLASRGVMGGSPPSGKDELLSCDHWAPRVRLEKHLLDITDLCTGIDPRKGRIWSVGVLDDKIHGVDRRQAIVGFVVRRHSAPQRLGPVRRFGDRSIDIEVPKTRHVIGLPCQTRGATLLEKAKEVELT